MEVQLRDYQIAPGRMDDWIRAWRHGVVPLRRSAGFHVLGAWVGSGHDRFMWLLGYDGADGFSAADARYYASTSRAALDPDPAVLVIRAKDTMVQSVSFD